MTEIKSQHASFCFNSNLRRVFPCGYVHSKSMLFLYAPLKFLPILLTYMFNIYVFVLIWKSEPLSLERSNNESNSPGYFAGDCAARAAWTLKSSACCSMIHCTSLPLHFVQWFEGCGGKLIFCMKLLEKPAHTQSNLKYLGE